MEKQSAFNKIFPNPELIKRQFANYYARPIDERASMVWSGSGFAPPVPKLDTLGISGSQTVWERDAPVKKPDHWQFEHDQRNRVKVQMEEIYQYSTREPYWEEVVLLNKAKAAIQTCGSAFIVEKEGPNSYKYVSSFHCKRKYCPRCAAKKTNLMIAKYSAFFGTDNKKAAELLKEYDLGFLTVTLAHGEHSRKGWYAKELATHFRNALKYGEFNKYIKGGCYQTEVNYGQNGFHIHRHCIVLIPKKYRLKTSGKWQTNSKGFREFRATSKWIINKLKAAWHQRTGDSYQLDLKPIDPEKDLTKSLCEIFKYLSNGTVEKKGLVCGEIVKELQRNPREKFYGRFGVLHGISELNISADKVEEEEENKDPFHVPPTLYIARGLTKTRKGWKFQSLSPVEDRKDRPAMKILMEKCLYLRKSHILKAEERSCKKHEIFRPVHDF